MPGKQKFIINKVNNNQQQTDLPIKFPKFPKLSLESIEDKNKIKKEVVDELFKPNNIQQTIQKEQYSNSDYSDSDYSNSEYSDNLHKRSRESKRSSSSEYSSRSNYSKSSQSSSGISDRLIDMLREDNKGGGGGGGELPELNDLDNLDNRPTLESEEDKKRELLFKFELLKKSYKGKDIPDYNIHTDYNTLNKGYDVTLKRLTIDNNVDNYKTYLIGGFMLVEFVFGKYLKFDMQGFTSEQMKNINSYDKLLVELGEKSYVPEDQKWPVEVRLMCLILFNAALFIAGKMILKSTGDNLFSMINTMSKNVTNPTPKRKMKSPNFTD
jgi:hypothetical protein